MARAKKTEAPKDRLREREINEQARHLATFPELNPNPVLEVQVAGNITFANPASRRVLEQLGLDPAHVSAFLPADIDSILRDWDKTSALSLEREVRLQEKVFGETVTLVPEFAVARIYGHDITERKTMEQALVRSNTKLSEVLDSIQDDFYVLDRDWIFVYASRRFTSRIGKTSADFVGNCIWEMFPKHIGTDYEKNLRATMEKREIRRFEVGGRYTDAWYSMTCFPSAEGITVLGTDITERKRAEEALMDSRTRLQALVETTSDFIWEMDSRGMYTYCSPQLRMLWGFDPDGMVGKAPFDLVPPQDREQARRTFSEVAASKSAFRNMQVRSYDATGRVRFLEVSGVPFCDATGELKGFRGISRDITERKQAEQALRESEERFRLAAQATNDAIWDIDLATGSVRWNERYVTLFGRPPETSGSWQWWIDHIHPEDRERTVGSLSSAIGGAESKWNCEYRFRRADGEWAYIYDRAHIARDESGKAWRVIGAMQDQTERKHSEETLRRLTEELQAVLETVPAAVFITRDAEASTITGNRAARELVAVPTGANISKSAPEEERPTGWQEMKESVPISPKDLPLQRAARGQEVRDYEMELVFQDGTVKSVLGNATPLRDEHGSPQGGIAVLMDVTQRKQMQESLQEAVRQLKDSEEKYRDLVENANSIILRMDRDGRLDFVNAFGSKFFGYAPDEILGNNVRMLIPSVESSSGRGLEDLAETILENPDGFSENVNENVCKNGERVWVSWRNKSIRDAQGNLAGNLAIGQDITARKLAEEHVRRLNQDLEERAGELEVANEELERLATSLALDLRSPLVSLRGVARVLAQDYGTHLPPQAQELIQLIHGNAEEMEQLTQGLLRLMHVTRQSYRKQDVYPHEIVRAAWAELEPEREGRQVEFVVGELPPCRADPLLLKQVWVNLLSNALKATRHRVSACIDAGAHREENRVVYFVRDNGIGFDMSYAGTIFRAFQSFHRAEEWQGSGVGLAIVDGIIRRHGGRVWAEGAVDEGATFYFEL